MCIMMMMDATSGVVKLRSISSMSGVLEPTVGDVFSDPEFSAPGNSFLWGHGALEEPNRECAGMPKGPYDWRVDSHGCHKYDSAALGLGSPSCVSSSPHHQPAWPRQPHAQ